MLWVSPVLRVAHWTVADSQSHPSRKGWHVSVVLSTGCAVVLLSLSMLLASSVISHRRAGPGSYVNLLRMGFADLALHCSLKV